VGSENQAIHQVSCCERETRENLSAEKGSLQDHSSANLQLMSMAPMTDSN
jgi:hypothetical protein